MHEMVPVISDSIGILSSLILNLSPRPDASQKHLRLRVCVSDRHPKVPKSRFKLGKKADEIRPFQVVRRMTTACWLDIASRQDGWIASDIAQEAIAASRIE